MDSKMKETGLTDRNCSRVTMATSMSNTLKLRSMRLSTVSRQSMVSLMGRKSNKSSVGSSKMGAFSEFRCYKHSPRIGQPHQKHVGAELTIFEATQWRNAFSSMGKLRARGLKAPKPFTVLNKAPYHCSSLGREFEVRYGELVKLQPPVFRKTKKADRPQICNCITKELLPVVPESKITGPFDVQADMRKYHGPPQTRYYLPKSTVHVRWDPAVYSNVDKICEWIILTFGPFLFTTRSANNSMIVAFETMEQAHSAVTFQLMSTAKIYFSWCDPAMYNFGNYSKYTDYTVATDAIWIKGMEEKARSRGVRPLQHGTPLKGKLVKT